MTKAQITEKLKEIGACWYLSDKKFVGANDPFDAVASYHIHPDCSYPHEKNIKRFYTLAQIEEFIRVSKKVATLSDEEAYAEWMTFDDWMAVQTYA